MSARRRIVWWAAFCVGALGVTWVYAGALGMPFIKDDYQFIDQARTETLAHSLVERGPLSNYYRPLARQLYFELLTALGPHPRLFHWVNYALFLGALVALADLLRVLLPAPGVWAGVLYFALLPMQQVTLSWASCCQDLLAVLGLLVAVACYRRRWTLAALIAFAVALASKESALPLPLALAAWSLVVERERAAIVARRVVPFAIIAVAWAALAWTMHTKAAVPPLHFDPVSIVATYAHLMQALTGLEQPAEPAFVWLGERPLIVPWLALAPLAFVVTRMRATPAGDPESRTGQYAVGVGLAWLFVFAAMVVPVAYYWSAYYYSCAAVGGALVVGWVMRKLSARGLVVWTAVLLCVNAATTSTRTYGATAGPWVATSHITAYSLERAAALTRWTPAGRAVDPSTQFFFAALPADAGFAMGNTPLIRTLYHSEFIEAHYLSQFDRSTAGERPCRFLYWNGEAFEPLYGEGADAFYHVGADLLLLDRVEGALHAFRRAASAGENRADRTYWQGWAELWSGHRDAAEQAWNALGFRDDSLRWIASLRTARYLADMGDTLRSRSALMQAIRYGVSRPEAHVMLGTLLNGRDPKFGILEWKVAKWLDPNERTTRRNLAAGYAAVLLDDAARGELDTLLERWPAESSDVVVRGIESRLALRH